MWLVVVTIVPLYLGVMTADPVAVAVGIGVILLLVEPALHDAVQVPASAAARPQVLAHPGVAGAVLRAPVFEAATLRPGLGRVCEFVVPLLESCGREGKNREE